MRSIKRQRQKVWHTSIVEEEIIDDEGNFTGEQREVYSKPTLHKFTVSSTAGDSEDTPSGITVDYSRVITSYDRKFKPKEGDMFFIDIEPQLNERGYLQLDLTKQRPLSSPDYILKKILDTKKGTVAKYGIDKL